MKHAPTILLIGILFTATLSATAIQQDTTPSHKNLAPVSKGVSPEMQNIRVKLEVIPAGKPAAQFEVLTSNGEVNFDNVAYTEKLDGNDYHAILTFDGRMAYQNGSYIVTYAYGQQKPFIMSAKSENGETASSVQFKSLGANGSAVIKLDEKLQLIKDPQQTVLLSLERATAVE